MILPKFLENHLKPFLTNFTWTLNIKNSISNHNHYKIVQNKLKKSPFNILNPYTNKA